MDRNPGETARKMAEEALRRLAAELKAGRCETLAHYLAGMSRFRGKSWSNVLLVARQRPDATRVAGFHTWNELGRAVRKGEKGIVIFAPVAGRQAYPFRVDSRATYVFDVSQTQGKPLVEPVATIGDLSQHRESIRVRIAKLGAELKDRSVVDAVAYVAACGLGVETPAFIASDGVLVGGDASALAQSLDLIQETSAQILDELLPDERTVARAATSAPSSNLLNEEDFDKIHREYGDRLIRSLTGLVGDRDKAEEIAARTFQIAWEKRDHFRGESRLSTWIEAIARNEARQSFVRDRAGRWDSLDGVRARELAAPELLADALEKHDDRLWLRNALAQLPSKHSRALAAHFIEGISTRDIARREGVPLGTVLSRIFTGKQLLREAWDALSERGRSHSRGKLPTYPEMSNADRQTRIGVVEKLELAAEAFCFAITGATSISCGYGFDFLWRTLLSTNASFVLF